MAYTGQDLIDYQAGNEYLPLRYYQQNITAPEIMGQTTQTANPGGIISTNAAMSYMGYPSYEAWLAAQRGGGEGGGAGGDDDDPRPTGTFDWRDFPSLINLARRGIGWGVDKIGEWNEARKKKKDQDLQAEINMDNRVADIEKFNRPNTGINAPGGETGQSPTGGDVAGTPFAHGGRIGFQEGGSDYGQFERRQAHNVAAGKHAMNVGGDGPTISGDDNIVIPPQDNFTVDTDLISKKPFIGATYTPAEWANIRARIFNKDITSEDDINFALSGEVGPFRADIDTNKNLRNISFNQDLGNFNLRGNTDLENYNLGIDYNKGPFFAGATTDNMGNTNFNVGAKWEFGQPEQTYNNLSWQDENPNLIYGQQLRYGGLASIL